MYTTHLSSHISFIVCEIWCNTACSYLDSLIKLKKTCVRDLQYIKLFDTINTYLQKLKHFEV